jgi:chorismate mutase
VTLPAGIEALPDLATIAAHLEGLEETIISKLIDRGQFAQNLVIYQPGNSGFEGAGEQSLLLLRLRRHEEMDAEFGRFRVPEERPYFRDLPPPRRRTPPAPPYLLIDDFDRVNLSERIVAAYRSLIPEICLQGDDGHYGSSCEHDVFAIQALGRRVHFGAMYVAESKYAADPGRYDELIDRKDVEGIIDRLTRAEIEERILDRVAQKVEHLQAQINTTVRRRIPSDAVNRFYRNHVIPLTKQGEAAYLLTRRRGSIASR